MGVGSQVALSWMSSMNAIGVYDLILIRSWLMKAMKISGAITLPWGTALWKGVGEEV